jgi:hypothetical protein
MQRDGPNREAATGSKSKNKSCDVGSKANAEQIGCCARKE